MSVQVGVVGKDTVFRILTTDEVEKYLKDAENWKKGG